MRQNSIRSSSLMISHVCHSFTFLFFSYFKREILLLYIFNNGCYNFFNSNFIIFPRSIPNISYKQNNHREPHSFLSNSQKSQKKKYIYNQEEVYRKFLSNVSSKGKKLTKQIPPKKEKIFENSYSHSFDEIRKIENK